MCFRHYPISNKKDVNISTHAVSFNIASELLLKSYLVDEHGIQFNNLDKLNPWDNKHANLLISAII